MYRQFQELLSEIVCLWLSSRFFISVIIFWIVSKSILFQEKYEFSCSHWPQIFVDLS